MMMETLNILYLGQSSTTPMTTTQKDYFANINTFIQALCTAAVIWFAKTVVSTDNKVTDIQAQLHYEQQQIDETKQKGAENALHQVDIITRLSQLEFYYNNQNRKQK